MCNHDFLVEVKARLRHNWRLVFCVFAPLILSPIAWLGHDGNYHEPSTDPNQKFRTAYVIVLMAVFWVLEVIPLAVTSLFPVALFPLLDVQDAATVSKNYMKESNMIFLGAIVLALSIEYCGLHIRIALGVIRICGTNPARIMLGTMVVTSMMSMWLSATSCTTMIIPILSAITSAMFREEQSEIVIHRHSHVVRDDSQNQTLAPRSSSFDVPIVPRVRRESHVFANSALQGHLNNAKRRSRRFDKAKILPHPNIPNTTSSDSLNSKTMIPIHSNYSLSEYHGRWVTEEKADLEDNDDTQDKARRASVSSRTVSSISFITDGVGVPPAKEEADNSKQQDKPEANEHDTNGQTSVDNEPNDEEKETKIVKMLLFAVAYSASIGGTGSLVGTGPIKIFKELIKEYKLDKNPELMGITFTTWMGFNIPPLIVNVMITWLFLTFRYIGFKNLFKTTKNSEIEQQKVKEYLRNEFEKLGPVTAHQIGVGVIFISVVILWLFRDPQFFPGWNTLNKSAVTGDSTPAMIGVILLFVIPKDWTFLKFGKKQKYCPEHKYEALLDWKFVSTNAPWGYVLLIGSGYAIADASQKSLLSKFIGEELKTLSNVSHSALLLIVMFLTSLITEVVSNTACASLILPVLFGVSCGLKIHPSYLTMASAITASYAFMLPISSPPNAIVFATGQLRIQEMLWNGLCLNIACNLVLYVFFITYGELFFEFSSFHDHFESVYQNCTTFNTLM